MGRHLLRSWVKALQPRRPIRRRPPTARLTLERFEDRTVPSTSIPLNSLTWTSIGPSPIILGQEPGNVASTGRVNGVAVDSTRVLPNGNPAPSILYAAGDTGGLWRSTDGGATWSPRTDFQQLFMQTLTVVPRGPTSDLTGSQNTVYAFDQLGKLFISTNGADTFTQSSPFPDGAFVNKLIVVPGATQGTDLLYAAVGTLFGSPPSIPPAPGNDPERIPGSGIWRSADGGQTWSNIVNPALSPFTTNPTNPLPSGSLSFSDVVVNPTNPSIVYAAVGNASGDPTNGVYRTTNALSPNPTWSLLIGGSAFVPGQTPGVIKLSISPLSPSVVFASIALRLDPDTNTVPLLGVFRTIDSGANWAPVLLPNPNNPIFDPANFMGLFGYDNNVVAVSPTNQFGNSSNPFQQTVVLAGFGFQNNSRTALVSTNSGQSWTPIGVGVDGVGTYPNVHQGVFDTRGRLVVATGGGVFRLNSVGPARWESLNGTAGAQGLNVSQVHGLGLHPTDPDQAVANMSFAGDLPNAVAAGVRANFGPALHNAAVFFDSGNEDGDPTNGNDAYGWFSVDFDQTLGFDNNTGRGQVIYNPFNPNIIYRTVPNDGTGNFIRRSIDGGVTWAPVTNGFEPGGGGIPFLTLDPSQPNRLFSGFFNVQVSDDGGDNWFESMQVGALGGFNAVPHLPTAEAGLPITAIGVGRTSGADFGGTGINGVSLFVGTPDDVWRDPPEPAVSPVTNESSDNDSPTNIPASAALPLRPPAPATIGPQLWVNLIPTNVVNFPGGGIIWDEHSWGNLTPDLVNNETGAAQPDGVSDFTGTVRQIIVDPGNSSTIYVFTSTGQVFRGTNFNFIYVQAGPGDPGGTISLDGTLIGYAPDGIQTPNGPSEPINAASITWTDLSGDLPPGTFLVPVVQGLGLDSQVITDLNDDILYTVAPTGGVWRLNNPGADFGTTPPDWVEVGLFDHDADPTTPAIQSMPPAQVTSIAVNSTTGILGASTYGRGVFEMQIRGLIRGRVFTDTNGNGQFDTGEPAAANATIQLLDLDNNSTIIAATTTDATGFYEFRSLRGGNFEVRAVLAAGVIQTTAPLVFNNFTQQSTFDIGDPGLDPAVVSIGTFRAGAISGTKFQDTDGDGIRDGNEPGLGGFVIFADGNDDGVLDPGEPSTTTAANGFFTLTNLGPAKILGADNPATFNGAYLIREVQQSGFVQSTPLLAPITVTSNQTVANRLIGNRPLPSASGVAFTDRDGDGVRDAGEAGLGGISLQLDGPGGPFTTTTAADGSYIFRGLNPGNYTLTQQVQPGFTVTTTNPLAVVVGANSTITGLNFGNFDNVTVSGVKFDDVDGDGTRDAGEPGVGGFTFQLVNPATNAVITEASSDGTGAYSFTDVGPLPGGAAYAVREKPQAGWVQTSANPPAFTPLSGTDVTTAAVGNFRAFSINGTAFTDTNGNGVKDAGEPGLAGVPVRATGTDSAGTPQTVVATTDASGLYEFQGLRVGTYTLTVTTVGNQVLTTAAPPPVVGTQAATFTENFGVFVRGSISGLAYQDNDSDGVRDPGEPGLAGYVIFIDQNNNGSFDGGELSAVTNATGAYSFPNLGPAVIAGAPNPRTFNGSYVVRAIQQTGFQATVPGAGQANSVALASGQAAANVNFGNLPTGTTPTGVPTLVTANDAGGPSTVVVRNPATNEVKLAFDAYPGFTGGVRVATGNFNSDSTPDIVTAAGPGGGPHIRVFDGATGAVINEFYAFGAGFTGGVYVATGDVNGDGRTDIITGAGEGGGPHVRVFSGLNGSIIREFYAYQPRFLVGVRVASGDFDDDGLADIVTGAGPGGGPHVQVFGGNGVQLKSFYAYASNFTAGIYVAAGDVNGDTVSDIITGPGGGGGPHLRVFNGVDGSILSETYAFPPAGWSSGLRVGTADVNGDGRDDVLVGPGRGRSPQVRALDGVSMVDLLGTTLTVGDPAFLGGIFVGGG